jgi:hypothetical protein
MLGPWPLANMRRERRVAVGPTELPKAQVPLATIHGTVTAAPSSYCNLTFMPRATEERGQSRESDKESYSRHSQDVRHSQAMRGVLAPSGLAEPDLVNKRSDVRTTERLGRNGISTRPHTTARFRPNTEGNPCSDA